MKTYLVTGGAGFIGAHVAAALAKAGKKVVVVDDFNSGIYSANLKIDRVKYLLKPLKIKVQKVDIRNKLNLGRVFRQNNIEKICHLAAWAGVRTSLIRPHDYESANISGTRHIFELAREFKIDHVVYASSSSVYGANTRQPFSEQDRVDMPLAPYALTKRVNELQAFYFYKLYNINSTGLRFFTVYGPWGRPDMALFRFTQTILQGQPIKIHNYGKMKRDFTYIDDIVSGVLLALRRPLKYEIFNFGGGDPVTLMRFIKVLEKTMGRKAKLQKVAMQLGEVPETAASILKAKKLLGYQPKTSVELGIPKFWQWYKEYYNV